MRNENSNHPVPASRQFGGALPKEQEGYCSSIEDCGSAGSPIRSNNPTTKNKSTKRKGEGPVHDGDILPFALRSLYRVVVRFHEADALISALCMDMLLNIHSDEESLRYFPDLTDADTSERIIRKQGFTIFLSSSCTAEQVRDRFSPLSYVACVEIRDI
ncbi:hypothetical protein [Cohnella sp. AR92]|uniref:hypothetical protein n=1 Tax=Cohnella sp. AR92 TaxID=648716 RepID=UPI000F8EAE25|nr:hypothetical protein [Cohnella sp. AR92]RUS47966.1 hypothetical protein ELR57_05375 [Cohnella sp. AR92]